MQKRGILLCLFLLLVPFTSALYETSIYKETIRHGDRVDADGMKLIFKFDPASARAYVEIDGSAIIVEEFGCEVRNNINICIQNISFAYRNATTLFDVYESEVEILKITSNLEITHEIEDDKLLRDEKTKVSLIFENKGDISAEDVAAKVYIPEQLEVTATENCEETAYGVLFEGIINPTKRILCSYEAKAIHPGDFYLNTTVSYFNGVDFVNDTLRPFGNVQNDSLNIKVLNNISGIEFDQVFNVTLDFKNINKDEDIVVSPLKITFPSAFEVVERSSELSGSAGVFTWSDTLKSDENLSFVTKLYAQKTGAYKIVIDSKFKENGLIRNIVKEIPIDINCNCPTIQHTKTEENRVAVFLVNPNDKHRFKNVLASYDAVENQFTEIKPLGHLELFEKILTENESVEVEVKLMSEFDEEFTLAKTISLDGATKTVVKQETEVEAVDESEEKVETNEVNQTQEESSTNESQTEQAKSSHAKEISENALKAAASTTEVLDTNISFESIIIVVGIVFSFLLLALIIFMLKKGHTVKVKGKTLDDIESELDRLSESKKK